MRGIFAESMTVGEALDWGADILDESDASGPHSREDAALLLRHVLGILPAELHAYRERPLTTLQTETYNALILQRTQGKPIQYIIGEQEFFGLRFHVTPDVLIPRPETEHLIEATRARFQHHPAPRIADVGTGSGAIAVALAHALPNAAILALDISPAALEIAHKNALQNHVASRIRFVLSDLLTAIPTETFDAVVSNPPYIALSERKSLAVEVRDFEPAQALFAGPTGLEFFDRLIPSAHAHLLPGGWLFMEIGYSQREGVRALLDATSWDAVEFIPDLQSIPRVAVARKR